MSSNAFFRIAGVIFGIVAIGHLARIVLALPVTIGAWSAPLWLSWVAVIVAGWLSYSGLRLASAKPHV